MLGRMSRIVAKNIEYTSSILGMIVCEKARIKKSAIPIIPSLVFFRYIAYAMMISGIQVRRIVDTVTSI